MTRLSHAVVLASTAVIISACDGSIETITELPRQLSAAETELIAADNRFAFKLFRAINESESGGNLFVSGSEIGWDLDYSKQIDQFISIIFPGDYSFYRYCL